MSRYTINFIFEEFASHRFPVPTYLVEKENHMFPLAVAGFRYTKALGAGWRGLGFPSLKYTHHVFIPDF